MSNTELIEKMVGIALLVSPRNQSAVVLDVKLQRGDFPQPDTDWTPEKMASGLLSLGQRLLGGGRDDKRLSGYFLSLAASLDPDNDDIVYANTIYRQDYGAVDWSGLQGEKDEDTAGESFSSGDADRLIIEAGEQATTDQQASSFKRNQATISGLVVRDLGAKFSGDVLEILISIQPWHLPNVTRLEFATPVGNDMNVSFDEAISLLRTRYPNLPGGKKMRVSFDDKYTPKDGGSAGLAFSLLGFSLLDDLDLDPNVAVTGDVTVDWKVRPVSGVASKIAGAHKNGKKIVIIPAENIQAIEDMIVLNGVDALMQTQVFAVDDVSQAIEIVRLDRAGRLQNAIDEYGKIQQALDIGRTPAFLLRNEAVRDILKSVETQAPEHVSTRYLMKLLSGWSPKKLSLEGSVSEAFSLLWPYGQIVRGYGSQALDVIDDEVLIESMIRVNQLTSYTDTQVQALVKSLHELIYTHAGYRRAKPDGDTFRRELLKYRKELGNSVYDLTGLRSDDNDARNNVQQVRQKAKLVVTELQKLSGNHHFLESLMR
jgi:sporulation protein YlmC with PRC-barrel domain